MKVFYSEFEYFFGVDDDGRYFMEARRLGEIEVMSKVYCKSLSEVSDVFNMIIGSGFCPPANDDHGSVDVTVAA